MKIRPYFKWFDFWVGFFYDVRKKILYAGLPMVGIKFEFGKKEYKHWIRKVKDMGNGLKLKYIGCPVCGFGHENEYNFCPNCGQRLIHPDVEYFTSETLDGVKTGLIIPKDKIEE